MKDTRHPNSNNNKYKKTCLDFFLRIFPLCFCNLLITLSLPLFLAAATNTNKNGRGLFGAAGSLYALGSLRYIENYGSNALELGLLASRSVGAAWTLSNGTYTYTSFGFAVYPITPYSPGFFAAVGARWHLLWGLSLRGELNASSYFNGFSKGDVLLGASFEY